MTNREIKNVPGPAWVLLVIAGVLIFYIIANGDVTLEIIESVLKSKVILTLALTFTGLTSIINLWLNAKTKERDIAWIVIDYITYALTYYTFYNICYYLFLQLVMEKGVFFINLKGIDSTLFLVFSVPGFFRPFPNLIGVWKQFFEYYGSEDVQPEMSNQQ